MIKSITRTLYIDGKLIEEYTLIPPQISTIKTKNGNCRFRFAKYAEKVSTRHKEARIDGTRAVRIGRLYSLSYGVIRLLVCRNGISPDP